jgi:hypothetical protein
MIVFMLSMMLIHTSTFGHHSGFMGSFGKRPRSAGGGARPDQAVTRAQGRQDFVAAVAALPVLLQGVGEVDHLVEQPDEGVRSGGNSWSGAVAIWQARALFLNAAVPRRRFPQASSPPVG